MSSVIFKFNDTLAKREMLLVLSRLHNIYLHPRDAVRRNKLLQLVDF
jgi:hypothetical protein